MHSLLQGYYETRIRWFIVVWTEYTYTNLKGTVYYCNYMRYTLIQPKHNRFIYTSITTNLLIADTYYTV